jgi:hypothetical protein
MIGAVLLVSCCANPAVGAPKQARPNGVVLSWNEAIEAVKADVSLRPNLQALIKEARADSAKGLVRRAHRVADVGRHRTWLDGRSKALEDEIRETFALAMSDFGACSTLATELPTIAAAARLTGDMNLRTHVVEQLQEVGTWSPLQRPGWTLYAPGHRLPPDGKDGNWLATGCGVRAIVTALEIMGDDVDDQLRGTLKTLLAKEIDGVVDDWRTKRPWFVRTNNPVTNQWVLPTEGLVRACLFLGADRHPKAYELGVRNLLKALSSHGAAGEFEEGIGYANFTVTSLLHAARAMAVAGDRRAIDHPFLVHFPTWAVHHIQPGRMTVNCFDAGRAAIPRDHGHWRSMLSLLVFAGGSQVANWALAHQFDGPKDDLIGLATRVSARRIGQRMPCLFAAYERAPMVVWRDGWHDAANGVWVRGGHRLDQHDHQDRGHVNLIFGGKAILIEAGTPSYSNPDMGVHYASGAGHNVLQVGTFFPKRPYPVQSRADYAGWQRARGIAPITVARLDEQGGAVTVDGSRCYAETKRWQRHVTWTAGTLTVRDDVELKPGTSSVVLFRWHVGTDRPVEIAGKGSPVLVRWDDVQMTLEAGEPIEVSQRKAPDATLGTGQDHQHTCLEVRSGQAVRAFTLSTEVRRRRQATSQPSAQ